ncbi:hypothetical protein [Arthrobacter sp. JCM 19049]
MGQGLLDLLFLFLAVAAWGNAFLAHAYSFFVVAGGAGGSVGR